MSMNIFKNIIVNALVLFSFGVFIFGCLPENIQEKLINMFKG